MPQHSKECERCKAQSETSYVLFVTEEKGRRMVYLCAHCLEAMRALFKRFMSNEDV